MKHFRERLVGIVIVALTLMPAFANAAPDSLQWRSLFNGKDLSGWTQVAGEARYVVEGADIVGTAVADSPNSFLATDAAYGDFILEYEAKVDSTLNSGVQIRSALADAVVRGYQVEIDPSERGFTGGIYEERGRGWLYPLSRNEKARQAFRTGLWNRFRVEAIGSSVRVWVNGVQAVDLVDAETASGFIALQVHSINDDDLVGATVRWRNVRIATSGLDANRGAQDPQVPQVSYLKNQLTDREARHGWRLLWDGKTSNGWQGAKLEHFPETGWTMADGVLTIEKTDGGESTGPGDIVTRQGFSDFELEFEFRITAGANSGVKYFVDPDLNQGEGSAIGCEFQVLDDERHPDAKMGVGGNRTVGSLYDLITAENLQTAGRAKQFKGVGNWNHGRIVSRNGVVEHWLNHERVVEFDRFSQSFRALVAYSKYKVWPGFCQWPSGRILLQDHGDTVSYRSIKIREL